MMVTEKNMGDLTHGVPYRSKFKNAGNAGVFH